MKQYLIVPILLLVFHAQGFAQKRSWSKDFQDTTGTVIRLRDEPKFFINFHGGYALALGSTFKFYPDDVISINERVIENGAPTKTTSYQAPTKGLGQGYRIGAGISYIINDFINVGVDFDYFSSTISKNRDSSYYSIQSGGTTGVEYTYKERYKISYDATLLTISPNIMFKAISRPKWFIYNKVGVVVTFRPNSLQKESTNSTYSAGWMGNYRDSSSVMTKTYDWGIRNPSVGFMGGIGGQIRLSEKIRAFGELQFSHIVFVVRQRELTSYTVNGQELVETLPLMDRQLKFERNLSSQDSNPDPNQPSKTIIQRIPITYVGAQIGLVYR
nr:hypothetical protein [Chitinophagaceae bacterium]